MSKENKNDKPQNKNIISTDGSEVKDEVVSNEDSLVEEKVSTIKQVELNEKKIPEAVNPFDNSTRFTVDHSDKALVRKFLSVANVQYKTELNDDGRVVYDVVDLDGNDLSKIKDASKTFKQES